MNIIDEYRQQTEFRCLEVEIARLQKEQDVLWAKLIEKFPLSKDEYYCLMANGKLSFKFAE